jgi:hypothetical protein
MILIAPKITDLIFVGIVLRRYLVVLTMVRIKQLFSFAGGYEYPFPLINSKNMRFQLLKTHKPYKTLVWGLD